MSFVKETIIITGGAGFIGSALCKHFINNNKIIILDNFSRNSLAYAGISDHPNLTVHNMDVTDMKTPEILFRDATIVIHMAAIAGIDSVLRDPIRTMQVNFNGTYNVLEACRSAKNLKKVLVFSTSEVYGTNAIEVDESSNAVTGSAGEARWSYAVSKLSAEHLTQAFHQQAGLPTAIIRPFNIYGPGQLGDGAIHSFIQRAINNKEIRIDGDGRQIRAWCFIEDFINIIELVLQNDASVGTSFNIGNDEEPLSIVDLAKLVCKVTKSESQITFAPPLSADIQVRIPKTDRVRNLLGYQDFTSLKTGIEKSAAWYAVRKDLGLES